MRQAQLLNACSQNAPSGSARGLFVRSVLKVTVASVRQILKAKLRAWCQDAAVLCFALDPNAA